MADEETEFDFRMPGGIGHLVETALEEATGGVEEERASATLAFPKHLKKPESREQPTMLIDGQQASIDHAVAASLVTEPRPLPALPSPPVVITDDLVLPTAPSPPAPQPFGPPPRVVVGKLEQPPELALDIEAIAARPPRAPTWTPVQLPEPATGLPKAFWFVLAALALALVLYGILR